MEDITEEGGGCRSWGAKASPTVTRGRPGAGSCGAGLPGYDHRASVPSASSGQWPDPGPQQPAPAAQRAISCRQSSEPASKPVESTAQPIPAAGQPAPERDGAATCECPCGIGCRSAGLALAVPAGWGDVEAAGGSAPKCGQVNPGGVQKRERRHDAKHGCCHTVFWKCASAGKPERRERRRLSCQLSPEGAGRGHCCEGKHPHVSRLQNQKPGANSLPRAKQVPRFNKPRAQRCL